MSLQYNNFVAINIQIETSTYKVTTLIWDRDSLFVNFNQYWSRVAAQIAQKIAENTTSNWGHFNLVRTQSIRLLGINPESDINEDSSPLNILPVNLLHLLLCCGLKHLIKDKTTEELNLMFNLLLEQALQNCQQYLEGSVITDSTELIKKINKNADQILVTNDTATSNNCFIEKTNLEQFLYKQLHQINKENLDSFLEGDSLLITKNQYLKKFYLQKNNNKILCIDDLHKLNITNSPESQTNQIITINIDGASKGNPGPASIGVAFYEKKKGSDKSLINEVSEFIGNTTNNIAEYSALVKALEISVQQGYKNIEIYSDSELVVKQIKKIYKVKDANIKELFDKANSLIEKISSFKIIHIPREENLKADKLANNALK